MTLMPTQAAIVSKKPRQRFDAAFLLSFLTAPFKIVEHRVSCGHESLFGGPAAAGGRCRAPGPFTLGASRPLVSPVGRQRGPLCAGSPHGPGVEPAALQRPTPSV